MFLYNRVNKKELRKKVAAEPFQRITLSFYRYVHINEPEKLRDELYAYWDSLKIYGRIYLAHEGINAQMSIPEDSVQDFINHLYANPLFKDVPIKQAIEDDGKSFFALQMKVKKKIVADGLRENARPNGSSGQAFDASNTGTRLDAVTFHNKMDEPGVVLIDIRNNYESEVGHFKNAMCPDVKTFRESLPKILKDIENKKDQDLMLYCTGGIRCEKASAYFKHHGFKNVYQLDGGIIQYAREMKNLGMESKFIGKNFVFDERLGERITPDVLGKCYSCGITNDRQTNCALDSCHILIIQCEKCATERKCFCSEKCSTEYNKLAAKAC
jgi:UPF0176 protein